MSLWIDGDTPLPFTASCNPTPNAVLCVHVSQTHQLSTLTIHWQKPLVNCTYGDHINYIIFFHLLVSVLGIHKPSHLNHETFLMLKTIFFWERVSPQVSQARLIKLNIKLRVTLSLWNSCLHPPKCFDCRHALPQLVCAQLGNQMWNFMYAREVLIPNPTDHSQSEQKRKMI